MTIVRFTVAGRAAPQGSKTRLAGGGFRESSKRVAPFRRAVAGQARQAYTDGPVDVPVELRVTFRVGRPRGHYGTGRNAGELKPSAPTFWPTSLGQPGDLDKLVRAVSDGLSGIVIRDDVLIVKISAAKVYAAEHTTEIEVVEAVSPF